MERRRVERWVAAYERAWRTPGTAGLAELFTPDVVYLPSPWAAPVEGIEQLSASWADSWADSWEAERAAERRDRDEDVTMQAQVLAVELETAVVRVDGADARRGRRWRTLWVLVFASGGRCARFEAWPFALDQAEGHPPEGHPLEGHRLEPTS